MRVAVLAVGSRGDVEPFLALAAGLRRRGHTAVVATHAEFAALVTAAGAEFAELGGNPREVLSSPQGQKCSMPNADPAGLVEALVGGARQAGHRIVLHSGWSRLPAADALDHRHGARRIARALAAEDGVGAAVDLLESRS